MAIVWLAGCHLLYPYREDRTPTGERDGAGVVQDAGGGTPAAEGGAPADAAGADDGPAADGVPGELSDGACAPGAVAVPWQPDVVACAASGGTDQCNARAQCNEAGGWQLCAASAYLARGGATAAPPLAGVYWLAACVRRDAGAVTAPVDAVCGGGCGDQGTAPVTTAWECAAGSTAASAAAQAFVGLATHSVCRRAGADDAALEGFWVPLGELTLRDGALCCR